MSRGESGRAVHSLRGCARTVRERALLIESLRNIGRRREAEMQMRMLIRRFPHSRFARRYQRELSSHHP